MTSLKNFFKRLFRKKKNDDELFLYTKVVYNEKDNFIILVSFSKDYLADAVDFLDSANRNDKYVKTKFIQSDYETTEDDNIIIHNRYYLLISGDDNDYLSLYNNINCDNSIAKTIEKDIINNRDMDKYINTYFHKNGNITKYDVKFILQCGDDNIMVDDIKEIKSKLPQCFTSQMLLRFINVSLGNISNSLYDYIDEAYNKHNSVAQQVVNEIRYTVFKLLCNNPTDTVLKNWCGPQYLINDDDSIPGDLDDESIDDIFKQDYQKFTAIASDEIEYVDIDEELSREEIFEDENNE